MATEYYWNPSNGANVIAITKVLWTQAQTDGHGQTLYPLFAMRGETYQNIPSGEIEIIIKLAKHRRQT